VKTGKTKSRGGGSWRPGSPRRTISPKEAEIAGKRKDGRQESDEQSEDTKEEKKEEGDFCRIPRLKANSFPLCQLGPKKGGKWLGLEEGTLKEGSADKLLKKSLREPSPKIGSGVL